MPEITWFGWFHTLIAIAGILAGGYSLVKHAVISPNQRTGQFYLICTFLAAVSALMIYRHGGFGPAHALAVLTLLALAAGFLVPRLPFLSNHAEVLQAFCFSGTLLFHMVPAVTDGLLRLPAGDPVLSQPDDPLLLKLYLLLVVLFITGYGLQYRWLRGQARA